tara:strand:- start:1995 stop:3356 length:1362 start_codon:yes stop_codon:yes gene_type:complete
MVPAYGLILLFLLCVPGQGIASASLSGLEILESASASLIELAERVHPAIVNISRDTKLKPSGQRPSGSRRPAPGTGSGAIIDAEGYIVTNNHVVGDAETVSVRLWDKTSVVGNVVGKDPDSDLAVIKIEPETKLTAVPLGDSSIVKVGQFVLAVGNPFGLDHTVTLGVVSGLGRQNMNITRYEQFIQTDASINPGNSGGPLFNLKGEVVGINTAIIQAAQGIGFSIPSNMVRQITTQLISHGTVTRGWLGIGIQQLNAELAEKLGVKENQGVLVSDVFEGDPGFEAGLKPGDIITSVDGEIVLTPNDLSIKIASMVPSQKISVAIIRDSKEQEIDVVLGKRDEGATTASIPEQDLGADIREKLGVQIHDLTGELAERYKDQTGVVVMEVDKDSPAAAADLRQGDLIKEIDKQVVTNTKEVTAVLNDIAAGTDVLLRVTREGRAFFVILRTSEG